MERFRYHSKKMWRKTGFFYETETAVFFHSLKTEKKSSFVKMCFFFFDLFRFGFVVNFCLFLFNIFLIYTFKRPLYNLSAIVMSFWIHSDLIHWWKVNKEAFIYA